jgi:hypothetical protein
MSSDRSALIRLASVLPKGSEERKVILASLGRDTPPALPSEDMDVYLDWLEDHLIENRSMNNIPTALGVKKNQVRVRSSVRGNKGQLRFRESVYGSDVLIDVLPDGTIVVSGELRGEPLPARKFRHRNRGLMGGGTAFDLSGYIVANIPAPVRFLVVTMHGSEEYADEAEFLREYPDAQGRATVRGTEGPRVKGLAGPMWGGLNSDGSKTLRYESWDVYNMMSR